MRVLVTACALGWEPRSARKTVIDCAEGLLAVGHCN